MCVMRVELNSCLMNDLLLSCYTLIYCMELWWWTFTKILLIENWRSMDVACTHYHMEHMDNKMYQGIFNKQMASNLIYLAIINNYIEGTIWADWWNRWCCRTNEAEFRKTLVYYTDGCINWNGYTMAVRSYT